MKIALVSDAWAPQVNGVVRTLQTTVATLRGRGHEIETITPDGFRTIACPTYPEIRLALGCNRAVADRLDRAAPDAVHIATEGSLGWAARKWCLAHGRPFTTSFHTRFPDYVAMRTGLPAAWFWPILERFHRPAHAIMVATETLSAELAAHGLPQTQRWSRGVDLALFTPGNAPHPKLAALKGPIQLYVGRVAVEKNIEAFLASRVPGTKVVVGDGPARAMLARRFPDAVFFGALHGVELASVYAGADVFVFPSLTDTFGLVMIEALASGVPVAAFPVPGPLDVIGGMGRGAGGRAGAQIGALRDDLDAAIMAALSTDRSACAAEGRRYSWDACTDQFYAALAKPDESLARAA
ncbi:glycosyltransferase family 1 protein [Sphingomonas sp. AP4-R1]|uniref:glycosyltransferase family 4 protein n=1 Tax=Sphingomonas sp. AP4-R1 TaxID=2735134 RepID=UPI00149381D3|nr:glycosyltransferase family 1 protein [Sphingomonas sp. AP4-R1]QJU60022.1 glycosyltransferase family 1 protein [Sphingomonas sp. AP4-R1]